MNTNQHILRIIPSPGFLKCCLVFLIISIPFLGFSATRTSTSAGGAWNVGATWVGGTVPGSSDDIIIATTGGNSVTLAASVQCMTLTINSGAILNGASFEIQIKAAGTSFVRTGTFNPQTGTVYYNNAATANITAGTYNNLRFGAAGVKNILNGVIVNGVFSGSGGAPTMTTGTLTIGGGWTLTTAFVPGSGKVHYNGAGAIRANTYNDLEISGAGVKTMSGNITVNGTLTVNSGAQFQAGSTSQLITLNKAGVPLVNNGTITSGILVYAGSADQQMASGTYNRIRLSNAGIKRIPNGGLVESLGTFELGSNLELQGTGSAISGGVQSGAGTLSMGTGTFTFRATFTSTGLFTPGSGTVVYDLAGDQTINASPYHNLQMAGSGTKTFESGTTTLTGNLIVETPTTLASSTVVNVGGNITGIGTINAGGSSGLLSLKGDWTHSGTFNMGTSRVLYDGVNQIIREVPYYTLQLSNGVKAASSGLTINKLLQIDSGATLDIGTSTLNIAAPGSTIFTNNGVLAGTGTVHFSSASEQTLPGTTFPNLLFTGGTKVLATASTVVVDNDWTVNTPVTMTGSQSATIGRDLLLNTGGLIDQGSGTIRIGRNWTNTGGTFDRGTGTVIYEGGSQTIAPFTYANLICDGTGTKAITGNIAITGVLTINPGVTFDRETYDVTLSFGGTPFVNNGTLTGNGKFYYTGTGTQNIAAGSYYDLEFSTGTKNLPANATVEILNDWTVSSLTVFGANTTVSVSGDINGAGTLTLADGTLNLGGSWNKTGTFTASNTGIFHYNGSDQNIAALDYYKLQVSNPGTKSLTANTTVRNVLTVNPGSTIGLETFTLTLPLAGTPFLNQGAIQPGTSTVLYTAAAQTEIAPGSYYNLTATGGPRSLVSGGTYEIGGAFTPGSATFSSVAGSTVNFNGIAAQTIPPFTFHKLILSGANEKSVLTATSLTVYDLEVLDAAVLNIAGTAAITITKP